VRKEVDIDWIVVEDPPKGNSGLCKFCRQPIRNKAHRQIGICANCMAEKRHNRVNIPMPMYTSRKGI